MNARILVALAAMCALPATTLANQTFSSVDLVQQETGLVDPIQLDWMATSLDPSSQPTWSSLSSVQVETFGIVFTTDIQRADAHLYRVSKILQHSGFATTPGPLNAVDIVLLENLHPHFEDMSLGSLGEGVPASSLISMSTLYGINSSLGMEFGNTPGGANGQGSNAQSSMSSLAAGFTATVPVPLDEVTGTLDSTTSPLGKNGHFGESEFDLPVNFGNGPRAVNMSDRLMVVPLPIPAVLMGIGVFSAVVMRRTLRR